MDRQCHDTPPLRRSKSVATRVVQFLGWSQCLQKLILPNKNWNGASTMPPTPFPNTQTCDSSVMEWSHLEFCPFFASPVLFFQCTFCSFFYFFFAHNAKCKKVMKKLSQWKTNGWTRKQNAPQWFRLFNGNFCLCSFTHVLTLTQSHTQWGNFWAKLSDS